MYNSDNRFIGKRLLILGGGRFSCEIIRHAKKMGITVGVTDWYPLEKSPAKQENVEAYYVSTSDIDAVADLIREKHFDGVITGFTDSVLPYYAQICETVGFPCYGTLELFDLFTNKQKYKKLLRDYGIPTIPEYNITIDGAGNETVNADYPVLVKPVDGSGARGISICYNADELKAAIRLARNSSKVGAVLVEEYMDEREITVFWLFLDGEYHVSLLGNRHVKHNQEDVIPLPVGYTFPASSLPHYLKEIVPKAKQMFRDIGIKDGMMFMQCKLKDGVCVVYDIGYRLTASFEYTLLREICGYDPMDMMINHALTGSMTRRNCLPQIDPFLGGQYAYNVSLLSNTGRINKIYGIDKIRELPGVIDIVLAHPEGDVITEQMKGQLTQIAIRVLGKASSVENMVQEMIRIHDIVHIISDSGKELLLPGIEKGDFIDAIYE